MDPERYYKYTDLGTVDHPAGTAPVHEAPAEADDAAPGVVYLLDQLSQKRPGPVLVAGFGTPLKNAVRAADGFGVKPLYTTGTDDKLRAFSFGSTAQVASLGPKFDERLFSNEYAILEAAASVAARTLLWAQKQPPSELLRQEAARRDLLLMVPSGIDRTLLTWNGATPDEPGQPVEWRRCAHCGLTHNYAQVRAQGWKCPSCGRLYRMDSNERICVTLDADSFQEMDACVAEIDPLGFPEFEQIIGRAQERSGLEEGVRTGVGRIGGIPVAIGIMETAFMMGSMGHVVGEKLTRLIERATADELPVMIFCASGGARMQEGLVSLMQMAKVSAAVEAHGRAGQLFVSIITDPTTGGVTASFATLGDVILAEPQALLGFAGRRVIQDTIRQTLPEGFQSAEFALEHGLIDAIVERDQMRATLESILSLHGYKAVGQGADRATREATDADATNTDAPDASAPGTTTPETETPGTLRALMSGLSGLADLVGTAVSEQTSRAGMWWALRNKGVADAPRLRPATSSIQIPRPGTKDEPVNHAWESVQLARNAKRPTSLFYIDQLVDGFIELHGDRMFGDDGAIVGGIGRIDGRPVTIVAQEKGADLKQRVARNFGCPQPEGYRKAQRLMMQAEKFGRPIVCLVDTQGAFCGREAEERGIGNAIGESLALMAGLTVPVVTVVLGEGGSGGALALAVANRVAMQEHAVYSVLSPEGFASILWKDGSRAPEAAEVMKLSAADALEMGIIEDVVPEGAAPAHENPDQAAAAVWLYVTTALDELAEKSPEELRNQRYSRFRAF
ncbi:acetyl-CoA carboxylase carboxyltransferase subunit alpha [Adlercreutzia murintestinalis]|uniref:acetyl-CoA carboxylase carboxyltransferase subunit alpha n=1 Tax=Adlercreutzia murintestinalis TaxID=2941325 RepID=UPI002042693E|nr:acetyl-CoA carboxylase carboxyltransferase subunit alpha [Adlercreutzia murintestinalis]